MAISWETTTSGRLEGDLICPWLFGPKEYTMHMEVAKLQYLLQFDDEKITVSCDLVLVAIYRKIDSGHIESHRKIDFIRPCNYGFVTSICIYIERWEGLSKSIGLLGSTLLGTNTRSTTRSGAYRN